MKIFFKSNESNGMFSMNIIYENKPIQGGKLRQYANLI